MTERPLWSQDDEMAYQINFDRPIFTETQKLIADTEGELDHLKGGGIQEDIKRIDAAIERYKGRGKKRDAYIRNLKQNG